MKIQILITCLIASTSYAGVTPPTPTVQPPDEYLKLLIQEAETRRKLVDALQAAASSHQSSVAASPDSIILKYSETLIRQRYFGSRVLGG
jgi:hypothetical protein